MAKQRLLPDDQVEVELNQIQGDVLIGLQKKAEVFVFFRIVDVERFRAEFATVLNDVTFSDVTKAVEEKTVAGPFLGFNIAFTAGGLAKLFEVGEPPVFEGAFGEGARARAGLLGDALEAWREPYREAMDGVMLATGISFETARDHADALANALRHSIRVVTTEVGKLRASEPGHEHFGYADGISQPGVRGLTQPGDKPDQGFPGQDLIAPGEFVFGYADTTGQTQEPPLPWMRNGSFMVFRRLTQDRAGFDAFLDSQFAALHRDSADQLGAQLVGRWKDGSPVTSNPQQANPAMDEHHPETNNAFEFGAEDAQQAHCPFAAHIRKVYPREDLPEEFVEPHRILRAGIPFGEDGDRDKGLLFVCYQTSIEDQFEFLQATWANNPDFAPNETISEPGHDLIIGQPAPRRADLSRPGETARVNGAAQWVTATGGGYFFSPSRAALESIAAV